MNTYGPYSPLRHAGNVIFVSGQVGVDPATGHAKPEIDNQTRQAIQNLQTVLGDIPLSKVVKVTVYLRNMDDFQVFNDIYQSYFEVPRPARTCVGVASLPNIGNNTLLVELDAVVMKDNEDNNG